MTDRKRRSLSQPSFIFFYSSSGSHQPAEKETDQGPYQEQLERPGKQIVAEIGREKDLRRCGMEEQEMDQCSHHGHHQQGSGDPHTDGKCLFLVPVSPGQPESQGTADEIGHRQSHPVFPEHIVQSCLEPGALPAQIPQGIVRGHAQDHPKGHHTGKNDFFFFRCRQKDHSSKSG